MSTPSGAATAHAQGRHFVAMTQYARMCLITAIVAGCAESPTADSRGAQTLSVMDPACLLAACTPLEIGGWPSTFALPCPSTGCYIPFDTVAGPAGCVAIPQSLSFRVNEVGPTGQVVRSTELRWTAGEPISFMVHHLGDERRYAEPVVPSSAPGWSLQLTGGDLSMPLATDRCPVAR